MRAILLVLVLAGAVRAESEFQTIQLLYPTNSGNTFTIDVGGSPFSFTVPALLDTPSNATPALSAFTAKLMDGITQNVTFSIGAFSVTKPETYFWEPTYIDGDPVYHAGGIYPWTVSNDWNRVIIQRITVFTPPNNSVWGPIPAGMSAMSLKLFGAFPEPSSFALACLSSLCLLRRHR